jgi:hypothetical protein
MKSLRQTTANQTKLQRVAAAFERLIDEVLADDFHGTARLELVVANGTIQRISRTVERVEKLQ